MAEHVKSETPIIGLEKQISGARVTMTPYVSGLNTGTYSYRVTLGKSGIAGQSTNRQSGRISVFDGLVHKLSTTSISINLQDVCKMTVVVENNEAVVAEETFSCL